MVAGGPAGGWLLMYVALTNIPEGELLTGFAMRSDPFYGLAIFAVHAHELTVLLHYAHSGLSFNRRKEIFAIVFFFLCLWQ